VGSRKAQLTVLNAMASRDFDRALAMIKKWGSSGSTSGASYTGRLSTR